MENERKRQAALWVWTQARLDWSHPSRTPEKDLVADQKKKKIYSRLLFYLLLFIKCVYFFLPTHCWGVSPKNGTVFFFTRTDSKNKPVSKNKLKKIINYPEYLGHCKFKNLTKCLVYTVHVTPDIILVHVLQYERNECY